VGNKWTAEVETWMRGVAIDAGFDLCGVAGLGVVEEKLGAERFGAWVDAGWAGEMEYLKRRDDAGVLLRSAVQVAIPWAQSVVVCAMNYNAGGPRSIEPANAGAGWIGRYAWSGRATAGAGVAGGQVATDYHEELLKRLRRMESALLARVECETRCYVDTGPLMERSLAERAGVGWIGKNTCVLNQGLGSWLLLAVIVTSLPIGDDVEIVEAVDRCGSCTRCIDACPTGALVGERQMDASRCIAYLTIEKKGMIAEDLRDAMGRQVFGCDICQDVCPWNRRAPISVRDGSLAREELINPALEWLAGMDSRAFKQWFAGSPMERTKQKRLLRNVAIAMGNSGEQRFLEQLQQWACADDPVLADAAVWAISRLQRATLEAGGLPASIGTRCVG
jgi:epoxyqueuosine reductase